jgi:copper homeostasis protein
MVFKLEICVDSVQSAIYAQLAGASRVELCDNLMEGGTTPSYGIISLARKHLNIGLNVLIRPRAGDFLYSEQEFEIMMRETEFCRECGADGIVIGILKKDGTIDTERTSELVRAARPMSVTFHRAYDMCIDPVKGIEDIIQTGADRVLTSGHKNNAEQGSELLCQLVKIAGKRIIIMPGSGISETNIEKIARKTGAKEFHCSARKLIESEMNFRKEGVTMGSIPGYDEFRRKVADTEKIKDIIRILSNI